MTIIDIFSGFLGAGKTTLIRKLIAQAYQGEKLVLIENEFGEIGIDGGFLKEAGIEITEMNSGCICCSLVGNFQQALTDVIEKYAPTRVLIEPSGVGKLSDVIAAVQAVADKNPDIQMGGFITVADANKVKMYTKNFGEFYNDQIQKAQVIVLSRTAEISQEKLETALELLRNQNAEAAIITTPWEQLDGQQILEAVKRQEHWAQEMAAEATCGHHHHHHDHSEECGCGHHHHDYDHGEKCGCGHHHHDHDHGEKCGCGHHHHDHHGEKCGCGHHHHDHDHHHADEVFSSIGRETVRKYTPAELEFALQSLDSGEFGAVLRAKGIVQGQDGQWLHFDYVPGEINIRTGSADVTGRLCVIGSGLAEDAICNLFHVK